MTDTKYKVTVGNTNDIEVIACFQVATPWNK